MKDKAGFQQENYLERGRVSILKTGSPLASDNGSSLQKVCHIGCMRYCLEDDDRFKTRKGTKTVCFR